jgi:hypothetical protein
MLWSTETREEEPLTDPDLPVSIVYGWPPDAGGLLVARTNSQTQNNELWRVPLTPPHAQGAARKIAGDPELDLYQPHLSPNGRWIVFEGVENVDSSALYVMPATASRAVRPRSEYELAAVRPAEHNRRSFHER